MLEGCMRRYAACCIALVILMLPSHLLAAAMSPASIEILAPTDVTGGLANLTEATGAQTRSTNRDGNPRPIAVDWGYHHPAHGEPATWQADAVIRQPLELLSHLDSRPVAAR